MSKQAVAVLGMGREPRVGQVPLGPFWLLVLRVLPGKSCI